MKQFGSDGHETPGQKGSSRVSSKSWRWISLQLSEAFIPVVMTILFFAVFTPIGLVMRWGGSDPLRLRPERNGSSYWRPSGSTQAKRRTSMTRQS
jgi:hypothetical protein